MMNQAFKVIQGHPYWRQQKSRIGCCRNVQQCRPYFWNLQWYSIGKTVNSSISTTTLRFCKRHSWEKRFRISWIVYTARNFSHWPTFLPLIVWVYLHSHFCRGLQETNRFCNRVRIGRSRSSKVNNFGTNRKRVCDFLSVRHCNYGYLAPFLWCSDLYWLKIAYLSYPSRIRRPVPYVPFEISLWRWN